MKKNRLLRCLKPSGKVWILRNTNIGLPRISLDKGEQENISRIANDVDKET